MSLYEPLDHAIVDGAATETFSATGHTGSPWSSDLQHGGPVGALLTRAMDRCDPRPATRLARVTVEFLGAVPITEVRVSARVARPGRRVELLTSHLDHMRPDGTWQTVARASGWRFATHDTDAVSHDAIEPLHLPSAEATAACREHPLPEPLHTSAFVQALEWRYAEQPREPGTPTTAWMRLTCPLVAGEEPTPLEQAVAIADVANGIGARVDPATFVFPNTELTVHLHEAPVGEWFGLAAETSIGHDGIGTSAATLHHQGGPLGRVAQALLVEPRSADAQPRPQQS
jgi:hypothetical protein